MKLFYSNTSPYLRKVRLVILEKGLGEQVETILVDPFEANTALNAATPYEALQTRPSMLATRPA